MMVIVSSCYYENGVLQQSSELDPKKCLRGCAPGPPKYTSLALASQPIHSLDRSAVPVLKVQFVRELKPETLDLLVFQRKPPNMETKKAYPSLTRFSEGLISQLPTVFEGEKFLRGTDLFPDRSKWELTNNEIELRDFSSI